MSYATEKKEIDKKMKKIKRMSFVIAAVVNVALLVFCAFVPPKTWKYHFHLPKITAREEGEMRIHFLDVGQGDCTIIELPDDKIMLIDGGKDDKSATTALRYLNALDVDVIDYLVLTHADSDHMGGLVEIVKNKRVNQAFLPSVSPTVNNEYATLYKALTDLGDCKIEYSTRTISLDGEGEHSYVLSFLYPYSYVAEDGVKTDEENNANSSVLWLDYQGVSTLFAGDAPTETEMLLMQDFYLGAFDRRGIQLDETEILKVAHHGSKYSTDGDFLNFLNVKTAVISCGEGNPYDHPSKEVLDCLGEREIATYRTDLQGGIVITVSEQGAYEVETLGK